MTCCQTTACVITIGAGRPGAPELQLHRCPRCGARRWLQDGASVELSAALGGLALAFRALRSRPAAARPAAPAAAAPAPVVDLRELGDVLAGWQVLGAAG